MEGKNHHVLSSTIIFFKKHNSTGQYLFSIIASTAILSVLPCACEDPLQEESSDTGTSEQIEPATDDIGVSQSALGVDGDGDSAIAIDEIQRERLRVDFTFNTVGPSQICIGAGVGHCINLLINCDVPPQSITGQNLKCEQLITNNAGKPMFVDHPDDWDHIRLITSGTISRIKITYSVGDPWKPHTFVNRTATAAPFLTGTVDLSSDIQDSRITRIEDMSADDALPGEKQVSDLPRCVQEAINDIGQAGLDKYKMDYLRTGCHYFTQYHYRNYAFGSLPYGLYSASDNGWIAKDFIATDRFFRVVPQFCWYSQNALTCGTPGTSNSSIIGFSRVVTQGSSSPPSGSDLLATAPITNLVVKPGDYFLRTGAHPHSMIIASANYPRNGLNFLYTPIDPDPNYGSLFDVNVVDGAWTVGNRRQDLSNISQFINTTDHQYYVGATERSHMFGYTIATGDFNSDGQEDLAVGDPKATVNGNLEAGQVHIYWGGIGSSQLSTRTTLHQGTPAFNGQIGVPEPYDHFGAALVANDFNNDGTTDLAIGVPDEDIGTISDAGSVNVLYFKAWQWGNGSIVKAQSFYQGDSGIPGAAEPWDRFGATLASGNFDGRIGLGDLAIGSPGEDIGNIEDAGSVTVIYVESSGTYPSFDILDGQSSTSWHQDTPNIEGAAEAGDEFGRSLAAGDFDGNGIDDLAIGVPLEDVGTTLNAGMVNVIFGTQSTGLVSNGDKSLTQESSGGTSAYSSLFGFSLATGHFKNMNKDDLAIGAPGRTIEKEFEGSITVIYNIPNPFIDSVTFDQSHVDAMRDEYDGFGFSLAAGNADLDSRDELFIGIPYEDYSMTRAGSGAVAVLVGGAAGLMTTAALSGVYDQIWLGNAFPDQWDNFGYSLATGDFDGDGFKELAMSAPGEDSKGSVFVRDFLLSSTIAIPRPY